MSIKMTVFSIVGIFLLVSAIAINGYILIVRFKLRDVETEALKLRLFQPSKAFAFGLAVKELERRGEELEETRSPLLKLMLSGGAFSRWRAWMFARRYFPDEMSMIEFDWTRPTKESKKQIEELLANGSLSISSNS